MNKTLTYSGFAISTLLIIAAFITAKTYTQLIIAVILYPLVAYFALKVLPRRTQKAPSITIKVPVHPVPKAIDDTRERVVADLDKRTFLKLIGTAGISFFLFSILGRRIESYLFDRSTSPTRSAGEAIPNSQASGNSQTPEGYRITEIDEGVVSYYGFTNQDGAWLIMREDSETSSFRYARGDSGFMRSWDNRKNLKYDYYYKIF